MRPEIFQSTKAAGIAGGTGAALILFGAGFESDVVAFGIAAFMVPLLGWGRRAAALVAAIDSMTAFTPALAGD